MLLLSAHVTRYAARRAPPCYAAARMRRYAMLYAGMLDADISRRRAMLLIFAAYV